MSGDKEISSFSTLFISSSWLWTTGGGSTLPFMQSFHKPSLSPLSQALPALHLCRWPLPGEHAVQMNVTADQVSSSQRTFSELLGRGFLGEMCDPVLEGGTCAVVIHWAVSTPLSLPAVALEWLTAHRASLSCSWRGSSDAVLASEIQTQGS